MRHSLDRHPARLVALLAVISLVGYALRTNISVAQEYMVPELGLTFAGMGVITGWGFQLAYALGQIPAGFLGDRFGARPVLGVAILGWGVASFATGLVPAGAGAATPFLAIFAARALLGLAQSATYPVGSMAISAALPSDRRATANGIFVAAGTVGAALAPLTLAPLMVAMGWRAVFLASGALALATALVWLLFAPVPGPRPARDTPLLRDQIRESAALLLDRNLLLVSVSYAMQAAVFFVFLFWFFRYLVDARGFTMLASGAWGSVPYFAAALIGPLGGVVADALGRRMGYLPGRRVVAMAGLALAAAFVVVGATVANPYLAIAAISLSVACLNGVEGPFWSTATFVGRSNPGAAGGVLNFMGNVGGVISIQAVPVMQKAWGWTAVLGFWAGVAVVGALLWLGVRGEG